MFEAILVKPKIARVVSAHIPNFAKRLETAFVMALIYVVIVKRALGTGFWNLGHVDRFLRRSLSFVLLIPHRPLKPAFESIRTSWAEVEPGAVVINPIVIVVREIESVSVRIIGNIEISAPITFQSPSHIRSLVLSFDAFVIIL